MTARLCALLGFFLLSGCEGFSSGLRALGSPEVEDDSGWDPTAGDEVIYEGRWFRRTAERAADACEVGESPTLAADAFFEVELDLAYDCVADHSWGGHYGEWGLDDEGTGLAPVVHISRDGWTFATEQDWAAWVGVDAEDPALRLEDEGGIEGAEALLDALYEGATHTIGASSRADGACLVFTLAGSAEGVEADDGGDLCTFAATLTLVPVEVTTGYGTISI